MSVGEVQALEDALEFVGVGVADDQLAFAGGLVLDADAGAERFTQAVLQIENVRIHPAVPLLLSRLLQAADQWSMANEDNWYGVALMRVRAVCRDEDMEREERKQRARALKNRDQRKRKAARDAGAGVAKKITTTGATAAIAM